MTNDKVKKTEYIGFKDCFATTTLSFTNAITGVMMSSMLMVYSPDHSVNRRLYSVYRTDYRVAAACSLDVLPDNVYHGDRCRYGLCTTDVCADGGCRLWNL